MIRPCLIGALFFAALLSTACGGDDPFDTNRDGVIAICRALCDGVARCADPALSDDEVDACNDGCVTDVCSSEDIDCDADFTDRMSDIEACIDALDALVCSDEEFPSECDM